MNLTALADRRTRGDAIQIYKTTNGYNKVKWYHPNEVVNSLKINQGPSSSIRGNKNRLLRQFTRNCTQREYFLSNRIVPLWNKLPNAISNAPTVNCFKNRFDKFFINYKQNNY